jgi:hypothetical protein
MNQNFIKNIFINSLLVAGLVGSSVQVNAAGFHKDKNDNGKTMTSTEFYEVLAKTGTDKVAKNFGFPDDIQTLKNAAGETQGVVWVYRDAVKKADRVQDARFVLINGEMKYVTLSNAS